jgi:hypothetical protein
MKTSCDLVSERVALAEPLGDLTEHAAGCEQCKRTIAMPAALGSAHHEVDPGLGFSARMTAGAQHLFVARRRRRVALGLAAAVAAGSLGVFVVTRAPDAPDQVGIVLPQPTKTPEPPASNQPDDDVTALVHLANVDRSSHVSAHWSHIEKPLRPYRAVLKGLIP